MAKGKKMSLSAALQEASGHQGTPSVPVSRQLKQLALEEDSSIQDLLREALNDLFRKRGRSPIA